MLGGGVRRWGEVALDPTPPTSPSGGDARTTTPGPMYQNLSEPFRLQFGTPEKVPHRLPGNTAFGSAFLRSELHGPGSVGLGCEPAWHPVIVP